MLGIPLALDIEERLGSEEDDRVHVFVEGRGEIF